MPDVLPFYKLIILYMLSRVDFTLTKIQISDFMMEKEYTNNFLSLQQAINELIDARLVEGNYIRNHTHLNITEKGEETLSFFGNRIDYTIKTDIDSYLKENGLKLRNEVSVLSDYMKASTGEYEAHLIAKDKGIRLVDITLSVPMEETAISICDKWQEKNQEIYQYLVSQLF